MSVVLEFSVDGTEFALGKVLSGSPAMRLEIERIVPTGTQIMPFVWATGTNHEAFEATVRESPQIAELLVLDKVKNSALYRINSTTPPEDLIKGIADSDATVLEAKGSEQWQFRLRFIDHDRLSTFHTYCTDHEIPIHIERTYTFSAEADQRRQFGLSREQREALVLALQRGYFATPSETNLETLADELDISRQALSNRIRRGNEKILEGVLLSPATDDD